MQAKEFLQWLLENAVPITWFGEWCRDLCYITQNGYVYNLDTRHWLKPYSSKVGYPRIKMCDNQGMYEEFYIHKLLAQAYLPNARNKSKVHHIDNNPRNNSIDNLLWVTGQEHDTLHKLMEKDKKDYYRLVEKIRLENEF